MSFQLNITIQATECIQYSNTRQLYLILGFGISVFSWHMTMLSSAVCSETRRFHVQHYSSKETRFIKMLNKLWLSHPPLLPLKCIPLLRPVSDDGKQYPVFPLTAPSAVNSGVGVRCSSPSLCVCCKYFLQSKSQTSELGVISGSPSAGLTSKHRMKHSLSQECTPLLLS